MSWAPISLTVSSATLCCSAKPRAMHSDISMREQNSQSFMSRLQRHSSMHCRGRSDQNGGRDSAPKLPMVLISAMPVAAPGPCRKVAGQMATTACSPVTTLDSREGMPEASGRLSLC